MRPSNAVPGFGPFSIARLTGDAFATGRNAGHFDPAAFPLAVGAGEECDPLLTIQLASEQESAGLKGSANLTFRSDLKNARYPGKAPSE